MSYLKEYVGQQGNPVEDRTQNLIKEGIKAYEENFSDRYPDLGKNFESDSLKDQQIGAATSIVLRNQMEFLEQAKYQYGEATVVNNLGQLAPRVLDIVRIFFPNMIANLIADIQPLSSAVGQIVTIKPRYRDSAAGVSAGQEVFVNRTDGGYASDEATQVLGTGNGSTTTFGITVAIRPIRPGTLVIRDAGTEVATDNGQGGFTGVGLSAGSINYSTGVLSVTFGVAPTNTNALTIEYRFDSEASPDSIRELDLSLNLVPVQAKQHPLRIVWSVAAGLAAQASYNMDVEDVLSNAAAQFVRKERDYRLVNLINRAATANTDLNFDAGAVSGLTKKQHFQDWGLKLTRAESIILDTNGRGNIDYVLCGINAADVASSQANFVPEARVVPIGAHKIGTINGQVDVIKAPNLSPNNYIFGFRGMQTGDAATILAEWIPIYFTPTFQNSNLQNSQGLLSMYDILLNNADYYVKGSLANYAA